MYCLDLQRSALKEQTVFFFCVSVYVLVYTRSLAVHLIDLLTSFHGFAINGSFANLLDVKWYERRSSL